jgi:hypothetical protein
VALGVPDRELAAGESASTSCAFTRERAREQFCDPAQQRTPSLGGKQHKRDHRCNRAGPAQTLCPLSRKQNALHERAIKSASNRSLYPQLFVESRVCDGINETHLLPNHHLAVTVIHRGDHHLPGLELPTASRLGKFLHLVRNPGPVCASGANRSGDPARGEFSFRSRANLTRYEPRLCSTRQVCPTGGSFLDRHGYRAAGLHHCRKITQSTSFPFARSAFPFGAFACDTEGRSRGRVPPREAARFFRQDVCGYSSTQTALQRCRAPSRKRDSCRRDSALRQSALGPTRRPEGFAEPFRWDGGTGCLGCGDRGLAPRANGSGSLADGNGKRSRQTRGPKCPAGPVRYDDGTTGDVHLSPGAAKVARPAACFGTPSLATLAWRSTRPQAQCRAARG